MGLLILSACSAEVSTLSVPSSSADMSIQGPAPRPTPTSELPPFTTRSSSLCASGQWCLETIAGGGEEWRDGPALSVRVHGPTALLVDLEGRLFFSERETVPALGFVHNGYLDRLSDSEIEFVDPPSRFWLPDGLALDREGRILISDSSHRVRRLENGKLTVVVGASKLPSGHNHRRFPSGGFLDGPIETAKLHTPIGIAMDSRGRMLIADLGNRRLRLVAQGQVSTLLEMETQPWGVAVDGHDRFYVVDRGGNRILIIENDEVRTFVSSAAGLNTPHGIAVDDESRIYIADSGNGLIRMVVDGVVTTIAGGGSRADDGPALEAELGYPQAVTVGPDGMIYVAERHPGRIRRLFRAE